MNGKLITLDDLRERQHIDLISGQIEVDSGNIVYRGQIYAMRWWNHYPRAIFWENNVEWTSEQKSWQPGGTPNGGVRFEFKSIEHFSGPFESSSGEIFFTVYGRIAVTIFPCSIEVPHAPRGEERYRSLLQHFEVRPKT